MLIIEDVILHDVITDEYEEHIKIFDVNGKMLDMRTIVHLYLTSDLKQHRSFKAILKFLLARQRAQRSILKCDCWLR